MTFKTIISRFESTAWLAEKLSVSVITVRQWGNRKSIPASYWNRIVEIAQLEGIDVSLCDLADAAALESEVA